MFTNKKYGLHAKDMYGLISSKNKIISLYLYVCQKECIECVCKKKKLLLRWISKKELLGRVVPGAGR